MNPSENPYLNHRVGKNPIDEEIKSIHKKSIRNSIHWKEGAVAGCFYCVKFVPAEKIKSWADKGATALCPRCKCDSIIFEESLNVPLTISLLEALNSYFMQYDEQEKYTSSKTYENIQSHYAAQHLNLGLMPVSETTDYAAQQEDRVGHKWLEKMSAYKINTSHNQWKTLLRMNFFSRRFQKVLLGLFALWGLFCWADKSALYLGIVVLPYLWFKLINMTQDAMRHLSKDSLPAKYQFIVTADISDCLYQEAQRWAKVSPSLAKVWRTWNDSPEAQISQQDLRYFIACARELYEGKSPYSQYQVL